MHCTGYIAIPTESHGLARGVGRRWHRLQELHASCVRAGCVHAPKPPATGTKPPLKCHSHAKIPSQWTYQDTQAPFTRHKSQRLDTNRLQQDLHTPKPSSHWNYSPTQSNRQRRFANSRQTGKAKLPALNAMRFTDATATAPYGKCPHGNGCCGAISLWSRCQPAPRAWPSPPRTPNAPAARTGSRRTVPTRRAA